MTSKSFAASTLYKCPASIKMTLPFPLIIQIMKSMLTLSLVVDFASESCVKEAYFIADTSYCVVWELATQEMNNAVTIRHVFFIVLINCFNRVDFLVLVLTYGETKLLITINNQKRIPETRD